MNDTKQDTDEKRFNETLKRMLETPPKPHVSDKKSEHIRPGVQKRKRVDSSHKRLVD